MRIATTLASIFVAAIATTPSYAYDHTISDVPVGLIRVYGNYAGVEAFTRSDGAVFPGCTTDTATMWVDPTYVTTDGAKAILAVLLAAKSTQSLVRIYYTTADGNCRFQIVEIE
jgi:hypothetical protein